MRLREIAWYARQLARLLPAFVLAAVVPGLLIMSMTGE